MAFQAKDGSKHTNRDTMRTADARHMAKSPQAQRNAANQPEPGEGVDDGVEESNEQDGAAQAQQHGPAVQIDIQHDHQGGRHSVHVMHPDGHEHESEHATPDDAHKFAAQVAGVSGEAPEGAE